LFTRFELDEGEAEAGAIATVFCSLKPEAADRLDALLKQKRLGKEDCALWTCFALSILAEADEQVIYKSRAVKAAAKVLVELNGAGGFPLHLRDWRALKRYRQTQKLP
jgi:hypothetical protein